MQSTIWDSHPRTPRPTHHQIQWKSPCALEFCVILMRTRSRGSGPQIRCYMVKSDTANATGRVTYIHICVSVPDQTAINQGHEYLRRSISIPYMEYDAAREYAMHDTLRSRGKNQNDSANAASTTYSIIRPWNSNWNESVNISNNNQHGKNQLVQKPDSLYSRVRPLLADEQHSITGLLTYLQNRQTKNRIPSR